MFFQDIISSLNRFWADQGCLLLQPFVKALADFEGDPLSDSDEALEWRKQFTVLVPYVAPPGLASRPGKFSSRDVAGSAPRSRRLYNSQPSALFIDAVGVPPPRIRLRITPLARNAGLRGSAFSCRASPEVMSASDSRLLWRAPMTDDACL